MDLTPLNLGMIAAYYYISYTTIELFNSSLTATTKLKGLIEILSAASEFEDIPMRHHEDAVLRQMAGHLPLKIDKAKYNETSTKANILLQSHFSRRPLASDLQADKEIVLEAAPRLLQAMVDVISSSGWLNPALAAMELSQMITQAMWDKDPSPKQLPFFDEERINICNELKIESIFDLSNILTDEKKSQIFKLNSKQLHEVAKAINRYPNIDLSFEVQPETITQRSTVTITVTLERDIEGDKELPPVFAPYYPKPKDEGWWLVLGSPQKNQLVSIKRVILQKRNKVKLDFEATEPGTHNYTLYFMCDSYMACDQEYELPIRVNSVTDQMQE